jgi:hypothetical protein
MTTVLVTGDRNWDDTETVLQRLLALPSDTVLVHGDARGLDRIAGEIGRHLGFTVHPEPANWLKHGHRAGPIRNRRMYNEYKPTLVLAFHSDIDNSRGTRDMVRYVLKTDTPIELFTGNTVIVDRERIRQLVG